MLDLEGKVVLPGFIDSHVHFISGGLQVLYMQPHKFSSLKNPRELVSFAFFLIIVMDADDAGGTERRE